MNILNYIFYGEKLIENSKIEIKFSKDDRNNVKIKYSCKCKITKKFQLQILSLYLNI